METNRIILRPWRDSDEEVLYKWASDPDVGPRAGWAPHQSVEIRIAINRNKMILLPNIITLLRMAGSLSLLFSDVAGVAYWIIYALCGISDIVDGWLARKLKCVTKTGALLDSLADICFVACCVWKLMPILELPQWLWLWAGVIVMIKVMNQLSALARYGHCCFFHTTANKWAGFLLFIAVPMTFYTVIPIAIVAAVATFAAVQEGHFIRRNAPH